LNLLLPPPVLHFLAINLYIVSVNILSAYIFESKEEIIQVIYRTKCRCIILLYTVLLLLLELLQSTHTKQSYMYLSLLNPSVMMASQLQNYRLHYPYNTMFPHQKFVCISCLPPLSYINDPLPSAHIFCSTNIGNLHKSWSSFYVLSWTAYFILLRSK
jgi:hypothetical protein